MTLVPRGGSRNRLGHREERPEETLRYYTVVSFGDMLAQTIDEPFGRDVSLAVTPFRSITCSPVGIRFEYLPMIVFTYF